MVSQGSTKNQWLRGLRNQRRYVATFTSAEDMGILSYAAALDLQVTEVKQQGILEDGTDWIKTQSEEHFPEVVKILHWPHLCRKIQAAIRALQPGQRTARRAWRKEQYEALFPLLWEGEREQALTYLVSLRPASGEAPAAALSANPTRLDRELSGVA